MQAVGLIETRGITAAIIGLDAMLKAANISILERTFVGGGNVSIAITGDIGAVTAAVEAGYASIKTLDSSLIIAKHIIPRPEKSLENCIIFPMSLKEKENSKDILVEDIEDKIKIEVEQPIDGEPVEIGGKLDEPLAEDKKEILAIDDDKLNNKKDIDNLVLQHGIDKMDKVLWSLKVKELRKLARSYEKFGIKGRDISVASKGILIKEFKKHYADK